MTEEKVAQVRADRYAQELAEFADRMQKEFPEFATLVAGACIELPDTEYTGHTVVGECAGAGNLADQGAALGMLILTVLNRAYEAGEEPVDFAELCCQSAASTIASFAEDDVTVARAGIGLQSVAEYLGLPSLPDD